MNNIGLVILAAGGSSRMGQPKQLLRFRRRSLIRFTAEVALGSRCHSVLVVLGANAEFILTELNALNVQVVFNPHWSEGMSTSIRKGLKFLLSENLDLEAVLLMLCDQPLISSYHLNSLIAHYQTTNNLIVASKYTGILGVPAIFHHTLFSELIQLKGDVGARHIIRHYAKWTLEVNSPEGAFDLDTPADYKHLLNKNNGKQYNKILG